MVSNKYISILMFILLPLALWLFLFKSFIFGNAIILGEAFTEYTAIKFYLDNLRTGVFPLWNPILFWGFPEQIYLSSCAFNPVWLGTLILNKGGFHFYQSFVIIYILWFFAGQVGFYLLAKTILQNRFAAYAAVLLLTFSSLCMPMFTQQNHLLIYIPSIWFSYFLVCFCKERDSRFFVGMTLALMLIFSEYLPFYFSTVFCLAAILFIIFYPKKTKHILFDFMKFSKTHFLLVVLCITAVILSLTPGIRAYLSTTTHEVVVPTRHTRGQDTDVFEKGVTLRYVNASDGGLSARMSPADLFSNLDQIKYGNDGFFYVSLFAYLVLALGAFVKINRQIILLAFFTLGLFFLVIGNASPVHEFLFQHTFYFKLFRNLHFLMPFILSGFILVVAGQLKKLLEIQNCRNRTRCGWLGILGITHLGFWLFFNQQDNIIRSSYATILFSFLFFVSVIFNKKKINQYVLPVLLLGCILVQPMEVLQNHNKTAEAHEVSIVKKSLNVPPVKPLFAYDRSISPPGDGSYEDRVHYFFWYHLTMTDSPGFVEHRENDGYPTYWSYYVFQKIPREAFRKYTKYKFFLYDHVKIINDEQIDIDAISNAFKNNSQAAFISLEEGPVPSELSYFLKEHSLHKTGQANILTGPSDHFRVTHFNANSIKIETHYPEEKFLVYNDSWHPAWEAFRNGKRVPLYRANLAFKGLSLPAGQNEIYLRFRPPGGTYLYWLILAVFPVMFGYLLFLFYQDFQQKKVPQNV